MANMDNWGIGNQGSSYHILTNATNALIMLLMVLGATLSTCANPSNTGFSSMQNKSDISSLSNSESEFNPISIDLMHIHHVNSPYVPTNLTYSQRIHLMVKSDKERMRYLTYQDSGFSFGTHTTFGEEHALAASVYSAQGVYIMELSISSHPRPYGLIMDTGSPLIWLQCEPCLHCHKQPEDIFNPPVHSTSYKPMNYFDPACQSLPPGMRTPAEGGFCGYSITYHHPAASSGILARETFSLTSLKKTTATFQNFVFGCGHNQTTDFSNKAGMVGLGRGAFSLIMQIKGTLKIGVPFVFSYCLVDFYAARDKTSNLLIGPGVRQRQYFYTPFLDNPFRKRDHDFYYVHLLGISVGGQPLQLAEQDPFRFRDAPYPHAGHGGFMIDSGASLTHLVAAAYQPLLAELTRSINYPRPDPQQYHDDIKYFDLCYDISGVVPHPAYPQVIFHFMDGLNLYLPTPNLFIATRPGHIECLAIKGSDNSLSILGNIQQQNYDIVFDIDGRRIGFAIYPC